MKKRYLEFDIIRVITLVLMPFAHVVEGAFNSGLTSLETFQNNAFFVKIASLGAFAFMCILGINILLTKHNSSKELAKRGFQLLIAGLILNIFRYIIPTILGSIDMQDIIWLYLGIYYSIASDILYFASLCFFFFAIANKLNLKWYTILTIGIILSLLDSFLPKPIINNDLCKAFVGNFIYIDIDSAFAFSQWLIVVCIGYAFGKLYLKYDDKNVFYKKVSILALFFLISTLLICKLLNHPILNEIGNQYIDYSLSLLGVFILFLVYLILQSFAYFVSIKIRDEKIINIIISFSKGITVYYILHWIIANWILLVLGAIYEANPILNGFDLYLIGTVVIIISTALTLLFQKRMKRNV